MVNKYPDVHFWNLDQLTYAGNLLNLSPIENAPNYSFIHGDITDLDTLNQLFEQFDFTTVVHFAAESHVDRSILGPIVFAETNTVGTLKLLEAARRQWGSASLGEIDSTRRFYHVSTDEVYGSLGEEGYFTEETPYDPRSPYSASKASSDHFVRAYLHTYGMPVIISNCSNNYGPYQFPEKLIPLVILNAIQGKPIPIYGEGQNVRDWLHVKDHCTAIERILLHGPVGRTYNIGGGNEHTNLELVGMLLDEVDKARGHAAGHSRKLITFVKDRLGHDFRYAMDYSVLNKELGWEPAYDLAEGLRDTVDWYLNNQKWLEAVADQSYREYYTRQYESR